MKKQILLTVVLLTALCSVQVNAYPFDVNNVIESVGKNKSEIGGEFLVDSHPVFLAKAEDQSYPAVGYDGDNYLVVWQDYRSETDFDIFACRVQNDGFVLDPDGIAICTANNNQTNPAVAFDGTNYLVVWQDYRNGGDNNIYGAILNKDGELVNSSITITSAGNDQEEPALAFCGTSYLVVWANNNDLTGRRINTAGTLYGSEITVSNGSGTQDQPAVVFGDTYYLVCWHDTRTGDDIYAARIDTFGVNRNSSGITVSSSTNIQTAPDVAYDGNNYLVVWHDNRNGNYDIYASRIDQLGVRLDGTDGMLISNALRDQSAPKVAYDGTNYLVSWHDDRSDVDYDIYGARVNTQGTLLDPSGFVINAGNQDQSFVSLVFDGTNYFAVWQGEGGADSDIYGARIATDTTVLDTMPILISIYTNAQEHPAVAFDGNNYLVVWEDGRADNLNIYGIRVNRYGDLIDPYPILICGEDHDQKFPAVAFDGAHYLVSWQDSRGTNTDVYACRVDTSGIVLDTVNIVISNASNRQEYVALAFDGTNFLACWQDRRAGGGNYNIYFTRIDTAGVVLNPTGTALCAEAQNQQYPDVVFSGNHYMIVWEDYRGGVNWDIFGSRVDTAGNILDPSGLALTTSGNNQRYPAVAFGNNTYLVTWSDNRNITDYDLYACRVDTNGLVLDIDGIAVTNALANQTNPEIIYDGTNFLLVWEDFRAGSESDIYGAKISTAGVLVSLMPVILQDDDQALPQLCRGAANEAILTYSGWVGTFNKIPYNTQRIWAKYFAVSVGWIQLPNMPTQIAGKLVKDGGSMVIADRNKDGSAIYAFRGYKSNEFYKYSGKEWTRMESMPFGTKLPPDTMTVNKKRVGKGGSLCYDGYNTIYATKGNSTYEFWAYNIVDNTWTHKKFLSTAKGLKGGTSICYANGKVYLLAGGQASYTDNFYYYDPSTNTWNGLAKAPVEPYYKAWKDGSCLVTLGNTIYALKGGDKYNSFWAYDIPTNIWTEKESLPQVHPMTNKKVRTKDGGAITTDGTNIYIIKGGGKQDFWKYTPDTIGVWTAMDTIPLGARGKKGVPKTGAGLGYYNYVIYLLKGNKTDELWQYALTATDRIKPSYTDLAVSANSIASQEIALQVCPNPIVRTATISYNVPVAGEVSLKLYNAMGSVVKTLTEGTADSGSYTITFNTNTLAKGIYFLKYESDINRTEIKLIVQ